MAKKQDLLLPVLGTMVVVGGIAYLMSGDDEPAPKKRRTAPTPSPSPSPTPTPGGKGSGISGITRAQMAKIQQMLTSNGYSTKGVDGGYGPNTAQAISEFQGEMGLVVTGKPNADTILVLEEVEAIRLQGGDDVPGDPALADALLYNPGEWVTNLSQGQLARIELPEEFLEAGGSYSWQVMDPDFIGAYDHDINGVLYLDLFPTAEVSGQGTVVIQILGDDNQPVFEEDMIVVVNLV